MGILPAALNVVLHGLFFIIVVAPLMGLPVVLWKVAVIMIMFELFDWIIVSKVRSHVTSSS